MMWLFICFSVLVLMKVGLIKKKKKKELYLITGAKSKAQYPMPLLCELIKELSLLT